MVLAAVLAALARAAPSPHGHLEVMTFYDWNATAHGWAWGTFQPQELDQWLEAWKQYKRHGVYDMQYVEWDGAPFWNRACSAANGWACGLRPGWQGALSTALATIKPHVDAGAVRAVFLGDEMMLAGISASNVTAAADFVRSQLGPAVRIYWNDGVRPFYDGHVEPCTDDGSHNPASCWTNTSKVPASVDWVSVDTYQDPGVASSTYPWWPSSAVPEADAVRYISEHFIAPKLHPGQRVVLVPGLFGNRSDAWTDEFLTDKMSRYWQWAQEDSFVAGFNPYHLNTRTTYPGCQGALPGPCPGLDKPGSACCYKYGAVAFPKLVALLQQIGRAIVG